MTRLEELWDIIWSETSLEENEVQILHDWLNHPGIDYPNIELDDDILELLDEYRELKG